jgi:hypothetical protein
MLAAWKSTASGVGRLKELVTNAALSEADRQRNGRSGRRHCCLELEEVEESLLRVAGNVIAEKAFDGTCSKS